MKVLFIDGYNLMHRARYGYKVGNFSTVYTFMRSLRAMAEMIDPDKIIFVLEGYPKFRYDLYPEYKGNRVRDPTDLVKVASYEDFSRQKDIIINIMGRLPVEVIKHPDYEGDDLIGKLVTSVYKDEDCVVATADTDFIQLFDQTKNVKIYNPIKKTWVKSPPYNYVMWKSMVGDSSDNIKGIHRVGPKTAVKVLGGTPDEVAEWLDAKPERRATVTRNQKLIRFADVPLTGVVNMSSEPDFDWVRDQFEMMEFSSMLTDKAWDKFINTFEE